MLKMGSLRGYSLTSSKGIRIRNAKLGQVQAFIVLSKSLQAGLVAGLLEQVLDLRYNDHKMVFTDFYSLPRLLESTHPS